MEEIAYVPVQKNRMSKSLNGIRNTGYTKHRTHALQGLSQSLNGVRHKSVVSTRVRGMVNTNYFSGTNCTSRINDSSFPSNDLLSKVANMATFPCRSREEFGNNSERQHQQQEHQKIKNQSMINNSMKVLMESMERSAMTRKLIKQFPSPFSKTQLDCGISTASSLPSTSEYISTKPTVVKTKRYLNQHKKFNIKKQLLGIKSSRNMHTTPLSNSSIPLEITIRTPITSNSSSTTTIRSEFLSADNSTNQFPRCNLDSVLLESSLNRTINDDELSFTSSVMFDDMASFSSTSTSPSWLWRVE